MRSVPIRRRDLLITATSLAAVLPARAADIPRPAPAVRFKSTLGEFDVAQFKGKVVGLEFLITTCPHCQKCSQLLQRMYQEYGPRGFQPLGVATNEMAHMLVPDYVKRFGLSFPVGWTPMQVAHEFLQHPVMLTMYVPQLVFIDRKGVIRAQYGGQDKFFQDEEKNMRAQIEMLLKEGSAAGNPGPKKSAAKKSSS